jgi:two-component system response regulator QseB
MLLDLGLPGKHGMQVVKSVRGSGNQIPILILTAHDAVADRIAGLDCGADDYIVKPFDLDELAARMRAVSRRKGGRATPLIEYGGVSLDPATRAASYCGAALQLSTREFRILEALLQRPGKVLSRHQLEEKLYGWGDEVASNTIEVYIHGLRKKLGSDFIRNVRGVGYMVPGTRSQPPA